MTIPIVCDMNAIPAGQRAAHEALARRLLTEAVQETRELPDGYALRFAPAEFASLAEFIASERLCCPFFTFAVELSPGQGPLWLRLTGPEGVKDFIQAERNL